MTKASPIILSLGGSLVAPNGGIDTKFLTAFNAFIRKKIASGWRFFIVVGGGATARHYRDAGRDIVGKITDTDLDWLGVHATRLNAHLLRTIFQDLAHPRIIENYKRKLTNFAEPLAIAAGWKPGWSTDYCAVLLARDYGGQTIVNLSNIEGAYNKDPKKFKDAKLIEKTTWEYFEKLVGEKWIPGSNLPFDPIATKFAKKLGLTVVVVKGTDLSNLDNVLEGRKFKGTVVMPFKLDASFYNREYYEGGELGEYRGYTTNFISKITSHFANFYRAFTIKIFLRPKKLLDVGCAMGLMVYYLRKLGVEAYGLEISDYALERAYPGVKLYLKKGDVLDIPYSDNAFDMVTTFDVLEHIEEGNLPKALAQCNRVTKKYVLHKIYTLDNWWITKTHPADISHVSVYDKKWWINLFAKYGYHEAKVFYPRLRRFMETIFVLNKNE